MQDVDQDPSEKGLAFSGLATMEPMEPTLWSFPHGAYGGLMEYMGLCSRHHPGNLALATFRSTMTASSSAQEP